MTAIEEGTRRMRLMRIGEAGRERPVVRVDDDHYIDVSDQFGDFDEEFFGSGGIERARALAGERAASGQVSAFGGERVGAPIARPHQIVCVGLNYADHARETGQPIPAEPILFNKAPNTLIGPNDDVRLPRGSVKTDWEVEVGVVIGKRSSYLETDADALAAIAGYTLVNDVSEREFQNERGGQWVKGKSAETFNPAGPWLATPDEIADVRDLDLWLDVSGVRRQTGSTKTMIFDPLFIVRYISQFMVLEPGDLIDTGTPPGVGLGMKPPLYLVEGDVMELGVTGLGTQRQRVIGPR
jgi:2-keto-4-pentenoate hydratase/2-oxohepta-3-ene-1,7-dioic acid hydratase in catechol pathway